jgi:hypothetical protein
MAVYISIRKLRENLSIAEYSYGTSDELTGRMQIDKTNGQCQLIEAAPNDQDSQLFDRTAYKLRKHWEKEEFPDKTCWAS